MKLVLFEHEGRTEPGVLAGDGVVSVAHLAETIPAIIDGYERLRDELLACAERPPIPLASVALRAPVPRPRTILCAIANYWEHAQREPRPLHMYVKNPDAVIGPGDTIELPMTEAPWIFMHEAELALVFRGPRPDAGGATGRTRCSATRASSTSPPAARGARAGALQLAGQVVRHLLPDRAVHHHRRRDPRSQRSPRPDLERRPAPPRLQHRRHGAPRARARGVRDGSHDAAQRGPHRLRHEPRGPGPAAGRRDRGCRRSRASGR